MLKAVPARGVIVFVHGLGEHIARYEEWFKELNGIGFTCLGTDHPGHGLSPGKRGDIKSYDILLMEVDALITYSNHHFPGLPVFLYGHSMGGNIVLRYLIERENNVQGAIVTSPWIKLVAKVPAWKSALSSLLLHIMPGLTVSNDIDPDNISTDPKEVQRYMNDPLVHDKISARLFDSMNQSASRILESGRLISVPVLLLHGTSDPITSHLGSREVAESNAAIEFKLFPGMKHELHHDMHRESVLHTIKDWLKRQL